MSRRSIPGDLVRVATVTEQREQIIDEPVSRERVEIERVPVGRAIEVVPEIAQEGDITIIPVVEEILVIERRLMLKEEIRIRRIRETTTHHEVVSLREQKAVVTRTPRTGSPAGHDELSENQGELG